MGIPHPPAIFAHPFFISLRLSIMFHLDSSIPIAPFVSLHLPTITTTRSVISILLADSIATNIDTW
jgi:hypothetical protein